MNNIIIISGPSGSGKSTLAKWMCQEYPQKYELVKSVTTRSPRYEGEFYTFVSQNEFLKMKENRGSFLETNIYCGNYYGSPRCEVDRIISENKIAILDIDVNGKRQIDELKIPKYKPLSLFLVAPIANLRDRLINRGETTDSIIQRLSIVHQELIAAKNFDAFIINENLKDTIEAVKLAISGEYRNSWFDADTEKYDAELRSLIHK